ncbi:MAG TPA: hypothetical protein VMV56_06490 [Williamwhitmania sp.]|nr:hypothetical protein [Williamwhitmania sp.]
MNKILILGLICLSLNTYSQTQEYSGTYKGKKTSGKALYTYIQQSDSRVFDGIFRYKSEYLTISGHFKDNLKTGLWEMTNTMKTDYVCKNCYNSVKGGYVNGLLSGEWIYQIHSEENAYNANDLTNPQKVKKADIIYRVNFSNGKFSGVFDTRGAKGAFNENGLINGPWKVVDSDGNVINYEFSNGVLIKYTKTNYSTGDVLEKWSNLYDIEKIRSNLDTNTNISLVDGQFYRLDRPNTNTEESNFPYKLDNLFEAINFWFDYQGFEYLFEIERGSKPPKADYYIQVEVLKKETAEKLIANSNNHLFVAYLREKKQEEEREEQRKIEELSKYGPLDVVRTSLPLGAKITIAKNAVFSIILKNEGGRTLSHVRCTVSGERNGFVTRNNIAYFDTIAPQQEVEIKDFSVFVPGNYKSGDTLFFKIKIDNSARAMESKFHIIVGTQNLKIVGCPFEIRWKPYLNSRCDFKKGGKMECWVKNNSEFSFKNLTFTLQTYDGILLPNRFNIPVIDSGQEIELFKAGDDYAFEIQSNRKLIKVNFTLMNNELQCSKTIEITEYSPKTSMKQK